MIKKNKVSKKIKAVVACGNGTAGIFAPQILKGIGCEVIELDCNLDWTFPKYNPNPEGLNMLHAMAKVVKKITQILGLVLMETEIGVGLLMMKVKKFFRQNRFAIARNLADKYTQNLLWMLNQLAFTLKMKFYEIINVKLFIGKLVILILKKVHLEMH